MRRSAEAPEIARQPRPAPHVDASATLVAPASAVAPQPSATLRTASLHERLRSTIPFAPVVENKLFGEERIDVPRERIARSLRLFNDSVARAEEVARESRDWTRTDENGERWGISVARLNLGRYTIPLQYDTTEDVFRAPLHRREEQQRRILMFEETERQVMRAQLDAQIRASLLEIRSRTDAKRDSIRGRARDE